MKEYSKKCTDYPSDPGRITTASGGEASDKNLMLSLDVVQPCTLTSGSNSDPARCLTVGELKLLSGTRRTTCCQSHFWTPASPIAPKIKRDRPPFCAFGNVRQARILLPHKCFLSPVVAVCLH